MEEITKTEILKKVKENILDNDLEDIIHLDNDMLIVNDEVKYRIDRVFKYLDKKENNYKTKEYYELIINFGKSIIKEEILSDDDLIFYAHFISDSEEANEILDNEISKKIDNYFKNKKDNKITIDNEDKLLKNIIKEMEKELKPFDFNLISRLAKLYNDVFELYLKLVSNYEKIDNAQTKNKINMINNMLLDISSLLFSWTRIMNCHIKELEHLDYKTNKNLIPEYEKDLKKVLSIKNIKQALVMFIDRIDTFESSEDCLNETLEEIMDKILNNKETKNKVKQYVKEYK